MRSLVKLALFTALLISLGCETDKLEPRKNPRFSIAFIQDIDASGVQFSANVYDFGNEEVLSYGFVYSKAFQPRIDNSEFVRKEGKPSSQFELKATHSMVFGEKYYGAAFMETTSGYVYSAPVEFQSKGAGGFVFHRIEIPEPLYFGDTIKVFASDLSRVFNNYSVVVETETARVVEVGENFFKFLLPNGIPFNDRMAIDKSMDFHLTVSGKTTKVSAPFKFKKPEFKIIPNQKINYNEPAFIEGDFMESEGFFQVFYLNDDGGRTPLTGTFNSQKKLGFNPSAFFTRSKPKIEVVIRGESYIIDNSFEINPSDFIPGQEFVVNTSDFIVAHVINKNNHNLYFNSVVTKDWKKPLELTGEDLTDANELGFVMRSYEGVLSRTNRLYFNNFGTLSKKFITVHVTNPILPNARVPNRFFQLQQQQKGRAVTVGQKGYFFTEREIYRFNPESASFTFTSQFQAANVFNLSNQFALLAPNGKIYTGADNTSNNIGQLDFFEFDPVTERMIQLPKIPTRATLPLAVYSTDKHLYYDGGFVFTEGIGGKASDERWRYEFATKSWQKVEDPSFVMGDQVRKDTPFMYKGELMKLGYELGFGSPVVLFEFDEKSQHWIKLRELDFSDAVTSNEVFVIGDSVYAIYQDGLRSINLDNFQSTLHDFLSGYTLNQNFHPLQSVGIGRRIYVYNGEYFISEFDPEFF